MSADFNTSISIKGTPEEIMAIIAVIKDYEAHNHDAYFDWVSINSKNEFWGAGEKPLDSLTDDELKEFVKNLSGELFVEASGPYGHFGWLEEVGLFEDMAIAAPGASFLGNSSGFNTGGDQDMEGELTDGKLYLRYKYSSDDEYDEYEEDDWDECEDDENDEDENIDWDSEAIFDPIEERYIKEGGIYATISECDEDDDDSDE